MTEVVFHGDISDGTWVDLERFARRLNPNLPVDMTGYRLIITESAGQYFAEARGIVSTAYR